jgi:hypothetical protein
MLACARRRGRATGGTGAHLAVAKALRAKDAEALDDAFRALLAERGRANEEDAPLAEEDVAVAAGTRAFVEGIAVLKLARHLGIPMPDEYPMCPRLALIPGPPPRPWTSSRTPETRPGLVESKPEIG